ncbi:L,D-transpeptidase family protein [Halomonas piscis]|uniref:L,D-transpeptidase family protein n=1 Tax=Halomonas piscis TaxID=3031727 RepID=A0ABY9YY82_9GAMM|nr:L,D-transpeptidase family protein [Halomonas piscis]WNK19430.1 L,D-transpeptidase family protein [Halomonas piscis]
MLFLFFLGAGRRFCVRALGAALIFLPVAALAEALPAGHYELPETGNMVGEIYHITVQEGDTLLDIAAEQQVGYEEIRHANPDTSLWAPEPGTEVTIPARYILPPVRREGLVINLAELRLYYFPATAEGETPTVETYPIGIGRDGYDTPLGVTKTTMKLENPAWYPPDSIRQEAAEKGDALPSVVPAGPDNPLGERAILLDLPGYLIHGTNRPDGVGMRVSHGCIRMRPDTIKKLFSRVGVDEQVNIIDMPVKIGRDGERFYLQAYPLDEQKAGMDAVIRALDETPGAREQVLDYTRLKAVLAASDWQPVSLAPLPEAAIETRAQPHRWYNAFRDWQQSLKTKRDETESRDGA